VSSKNAPRVVNAQGDTGVANAAILFVPSLGSTDNEEFTNNYEMLSDKMTSIHSWSCWWTIAVVPSCLVSSGLRTTPSVHFHAGSGVSKI
jgi:hypothetical protein